MSEVTPHWKPQKGERDDTLYLVERTWIIENRSLGFCEVRATPKCGGAGVMFHHKKTRKRSGCDHAHNLVHVCQHCHNYVHAHNHWSRANGFLVSQYLDNCGKDPHLVYTPT